jgi:hypothetical protein
MQNTNPCQANDPLKDTGNAPDNKIRCIGSGDWYWIGKNVLRIHGRDLGVTGIAVYNVLASYADAKTQVCFPTQAAIAKLIHVSRMTVVRKINFLEKIGLLVVDKKQGGRCLYRLLETRFATHRSRDATREIRLL